MVNTRPVGEFGTDLFWYAGGVPRLMLMLKEHLNLDVMTVTGKTLGENLSDIESELALIEDGDLIEIDIEKRSINVLGADLTERRKYWSYTPKLDKGILGIYKKLATSAIDGGYMNG